MGDINEETKSKFSYLKEGEKLFYWKILDFLKKK